mgnify:CR=1 FL=1
MSGIFAGHESCRSGTPANPVPVGLRQRVGGEQPREQARLERQGAKGDGDGDVVVGAVHHGDRVTGRDLACGDHPQVRPRPRGLGELLDPAVTPQPALERAAGDPRARDLEDDVGAFTVALPRVRIIPIEQFDPWTLLA